MGWQFRPLTLLERGPQLPPDTGSALLILVAFVLPGFVALLISERTHLVPVRNGQRLSFGPTVPIAIHVGPLRDRHSAGSVQHCSTRANETGRYVQPARGPNPAYGLERARPAESPGRIMSPLL